jgi:Ran GTPase-activating protein (RanGAP) involved in mRNA processing and transport
MTKNCHRINKIDLTSTPITDYQLEELISELSLLEHINLNHC